MIRVDDARFDRSYFDRAFAYFDAHPVLGNVENQRIAVRLSDTPFWLALCLYVKERGGTVFPLPVDLPLEAARRRAERSGSGYLIFGDDGETAANRMERVDGAADFAPQTAAGLIQTSSGTTGEPKYVERSWASIDLEIESYVRLFDEADTMTPIVACPVNHSYGLISGVLVALARGREPLVVRNPNPKYVLRVLQETPAALLYSSPTLIATLAMLTKEDDPLPALVTSGTLLPKTWFDSVRKKTRSLHQQYGCSEAGCITFGREIAAANEIGAPLAHLAVVAGPSSADPREIVVTTRGGRTIETRDLGYLEGGRLHFVSRLDDMINVSGLNVYPSEVEEVVLEMPSVLDAVVFKGSHGFGSDQVCLQFVAEAAISNERVRAFCSARLAGHQVPMRITQVESIPRLPNGKISRKQLSESSAGAARARPRGLPS